MKVLKVTHSKAERVYDIETPCHNYILENSIVSHNTMDQYNPKEIAGGAGVKYAASTIVVLNKRKEKDGKDTVGNNIRAVVAKSRLTKEFSQVEVLIRYESGMNRHWGLVDIAEACGTLKKVGNKYEVVPWNDGKTYFGVTMNREVEKFWTKEVLDHIEARVGSVFCYGGSSEESLSDALAESDIDED